MALRRFLALLALLLFWGGSPVARAQPIDDEGPTAQPTVDAILKEVAERYGPAAVALQGFLLAHTIAAGSLLEITVSVAGIESRAGRDYLGYVLDTGIVYPAADVSKREQLSRIFSEVIDPSLRKAPLAQLRADGVALRVTSYRSEISDRAALAREHQAQRLQRVDTNFFLPIDAIQTFIEGKIAAAELGTRGVVEVDGSATQLEIIPTPVPTEEPTLAPE
jgi:hypothetical protein